MQATSRKQLREKFSLVVPVDLKNTRHGCRVLAEFRTVQEFRNIAKFFAGENLNGCIKTSDFYVMENGSGDCVKYSALLAMYCPELKTGTRPKSLEVSSKEI